jgi:hypothetical protein
MKVEYTIKEVKPNIFAVIVPDDYHRPMLFCRVQEYYESPNKAFNRREFSIWDFMEWYSRNNSDSFTYAFDWGGFNIPFDIFEECITTSAFESPYDAIMFNIYAEIKLMKKEGNAYVIGADNTESETFYHEVCHGLYSTNSLYRELADEITQTIPTKLYSKFVDNLIDYGYSMEVMDDEIQAFLMTNWFTTNFSKKANLNEVKKLSNLYKDTLKSFLK